MVSKSINSVIEKILGAADKNSVYKSGYWLVLERIGGKHQRKEVSSRPAGGCSTFTYAEGKNQQLSRLRATIFKEVGEIADLSYCAQVALLSALLGNFTSLLWPHCGK